MGRRPASAAVDTRRAILDAALDLFSEEGFHATSMRALARAVGVRESALYHHFPSKDAILEALVAEMADFGRALAARQLATLGRRTLQQVLTDMADSMLKQLQTPMVAKSMRMARQLGTALSIDHAPLLRYRRRNLELFANLLRELQRLGRVRRDVDPFFFGLQFIGPIFLACGLMHEGPPPLSPPRLRKFVRAHVEAMARAFGAPGDR